MEVPTAQLRLRLELAGRGSPVGDGGDVGGERERGRGGYVNINIKIRIQTSVHLVGHEGLLARSLGLYVFSPYGKNSNF